MAFPHVPCGRLAHLRCTGINKLAFTRVIYIAQVIKHYAKRHVVTVERRIVQGRRAAVQRLIDQTHRNHIVMLFGLNSAQTKRPVRRVAAGRAGGALGNPEVMLSCRT